MCDQVCLIRSNWCVQIVCGSTIEIMWYYNVEENPCEGHFNLLILVEWVKSFMASLEWDLRTLVWTWSIYVNFINDTTYHSYGYWLIDASLISSTILFKSHSISKIRRSKLALLYVWLTRNSYHKKLITCCMLFMKIALKFPFHSFSLYVLSAEN